MTAGFNFALLDLADGESGEAAVSAVVGKAKAQAEADARKAESTAGAEKEKPPPHKNIYFTKLQHDNGIRNILHELKRLREVLTKLRGEETKLKEEGGDGGRLMDLSEEQRKLRLMHLSEEQRKLRQQQRKLREQEAKLRPLRKEFYLEHGFSLGDDEEETRVHGQGEVQGVDNVNGSCNSDGNGNVRDYHNDEPDVHVDGRQGYPKRKVQRYVVKAKQPSSDASTDQADHTPEDKVTSDAGSEAPVEIDQEEAATPANADAAPASGLENSSAVARATSSNNRQSGPRTGTFLPKEKLNGSMKRKKKNANGGNEVDKAKKQGSSEIDLSKRADKEPLAAYPMEEEKKTLAEYERIREKKKSSVEASRSAEARKVSAVEFEGLRILEKKKLDDESVVLKAEKVQHKAKETSKKEGKDADDAKPKKVVIPMKDLSFQPPRRAFLLEDGTSNGGGLPPRGRFNDGGFQSCSRDNSTDSRVPAGRGGANGRAFQNDADNYDNVASRGGYNGGYHNQGGNGGGYQQKGGYQRRTGNDNYRPSGRGYSANGRYPPPAPKPMVVEDMDLFPPLPASAPSRAAAPATAPAQS